MASKKTETSVTESAQKAAANVGDDRTWATLAHIGGLVFFIPLGNVLVPLVIWILYKEKSSLVEREAKKSLNFQLSMLIYMLAATVLSIIGIGVLLMFALIVIDVIFVIQAAMKTNEGQEYNYQFSLQLIK